MYSTTNLPEEILVIKFQFSVFPRLIAPFEPLEATNQDYRTDIGRNRERQKEQDRHARCKRSSSIRSTSTNHDDQRPMRPRTLAELSILPNRPRHPELSSVGARLNTFSNVQLDVSGGTLGMAEAGFFYTGFGDKVQCFYCDGCVQGWKENDNPIDEHQKLFPDCVFIKLVFDHEEANHPRESPTYESRTRINPLILSAVEENGYTRTQAQEAYERLQRSGGRRDYSVAEIIAIIDGQDEPLTDGQDEPLSDVREELSSVDIGNLLHENEELKAKRECTVCRDKLSDIMFLPCTHLNCCAICAPNLDVCPICRTDIQGRVKVHFATFNDTQAYEGG